MDRNPPQTPGQAVSSPCPPPPPPPKNPSYCPEGQKGLGKGRILNRGDRVSNQWRLSTSELARFLSSGARNGNEAPWAKLPSVVENKITSLHTGPLWFLLRLFFVISRTASNCSQNHSVPWERFKNRCPTWTSFHSLVLRSFHTFSTSWPPNNHFFNLCLLVPPTTATSQF